MAATKGLLAATVVTAIVAASATSVVVPATAAEGGATAFTHKLIGVRKAFSHQGHRSAYRANDRLRTTGPTNGWQK